MATRIESGQVRATAPGGVPMQQVTMPNVNYTAAYNERAQAANTLAQVIDRMSATAFQAAGQAQQKQALVDAANMPMTPEIIEAAKNGDMSKIGAVQGSMNLYDIAFAKARSFQLSSEFEMEAKADLVKMMTDVENGTTTSEQVGTKINTMTNGYASSLAQVDADAALKFTASMGVYGRTVMDKAYELEQKRAKEKKMLKFNGDFENTMKLIEPALEQGFYTNAQTGETLPVEDLLGVHRKNVGDSALAVGGYEYATNMQTEFDKRVKQAKINVMTKLAIADDFADSTLAGMNRLRSGNMGKMSGIWMNMPEDDKATVRASYYTDQVRRSEALKETQAQAKVEGEKAFASYLETYYSSPAGSVNRRVAQDGISVLAKEIPGVVTDSMLKDIFSPDQGKTDSMLEFNLTNQVLSGNITDPSVIKKYIGRGLTGNDAVQLLKLFYSEDRRGDTYLDKTINQLSGINMTGGIVVIDKNSTEFNNRNELRAQAKTIEGQLIREGKPATPDIVAEELTKWVTARRSTAKATAARNSLTNTYEKLEWINGPITRDSLPTLQRKAGNDKNKLNDLRRITQLLDEAEGK